MNLSKACFLSSLLITVFFSSCIKDDFVDDLRPPEIRILSLLDTIELNTTFQFEEMYLNNIGLEEDIETTWESSDESVANITNDGLLTALDFGNTTILVRSVSDSLAVSDSISIVVGMNTVETSLLKSGTVQTTSTYALNGSFTLSEEEDESGLVLDFADDYNASTALPGLYVYLSNNRNSIANALELGRVETFSGAHQYNVSDVGINDYSFVVYFCKPFNIKVGDGEIQ